MNEPPEMRGIIPNSFVHIFDRIACDTSKTFLVRASYLEIYNEEIRDLLGKVDSHPLCVALCLHRAELVIDCVGPQVDI